MSAEMILSTIAVTVAGTAILAGAGKLFKHSDRLTKLETQQETITGEYADIKKKLEGLDFELKTISEKLNQLIGRSQ